MKYYILNILLVTILLLTENGDVYGCGKNSSGQLGLGEGDTRERHSPELIPDFNNIKAISAGNNFNLFLTNDGHSLDDISEEDEE